MMRFRLFIVGRNAVFFPVHHIARSWCCFILSPTMCSLAIWLRLSLLGISTIKGLFSPCVQWVIRERQSDVVLWWSFYPESFRSVDGSYVSQLSQNIDFLTLRLLRYIFIWRSTIRKFLGFFFAFVLLSSLGWLFCVRMDSWFIFHLNELESIIVIIHFNG